MNIDGVTIRRSNHKNGEVTFRFFVTGKRAIRQIKLRLLLDGSAAIQFVEGKSSPGIEPGEVFSLSIAREDVIERLVRSMAKLHLNVKEAANGDTDFDLEFINQGFSIAFSKAGVPAWLRSDPSMTFVISKSGEKGLPSANDPDIQMIVKSALGGMLTVIAPSQSSLLAFLESKAFYEHYNSGRDLKLILGAGDSGLTVH